jgi:hypothetical protein
VINAPCYLAGGAVFGPFVSRNITPRANGLPANRTLEQFKEIMHEGTDFFGGATPILQVMPWPVYGKMHRQIAEVAGHHAIADAMVHMTTEAPELERLESERRAESRRQPRCGAPGAGIVLARRAKTSPDHRFTFRPNRAFVSSFHDSMKRTH